MYYYIDWRHFSLTKICAFRWNNNNRRQYIFVTKYGTLSVISCIERLIVVGSLAANSPQIISSVLVGKHGKHKYDVGEIRFMGLPTYSKYYSSVAIAICTGHNAGIYGAILLADPHCKL